jgi:hypothetical protein
MADASDPLMAMSVVDERCWSLIRMAAYGRLTIRASMAAVRDNRPGEATEMLKLARMSAVSARADFVLPFSP